MSSPTTAPIVADGVRIGGDSPPLIIAGPDSLESEQLVLEIAAELERLRQRLGLCVVFKGSYDKANRSRHDSWRGVGIERGLALLRLVKDRTGLPVTSDIHAVEEVAPAADVLDILQVPAFLCRQNDLLAAAGATGRIVNIKRGQFLPPWSAPDRVEAATGPRTPGVVMTERGSTFGHGDLVSDFRVVVEMRTAGIPVVFDASHSVQKPAGEGGKSGGRRDLIAPLARAAAGAGCDGFFMEVHPRPNEALCDGPSSLALEDLGPLLEQLVAIDRIARTAHES